MFKKWKEHRRIRKQQRIEKRIKRLGGVPEAEFNKVSADLKAAEYDVQIWRSAANCINAKLHQFKSNLTVVCTCVREASDSIPAEDMIERNKALAVNQLGKAVYDVASHWVNGKGEYMAALWMVNVNEDKNYYDVEPRTCPLIGPNTKIDIDEATADAIRKYVGDDAIITQSLEGEVRIVSGR